MEALVVIFAQLVLACVMPILSLASFVVGLLFELLALLFGGVFAALVEKRRKPGYAPVGSTEAPSRPRPAPIVTHPAKPILSRRAVHWIAGSCAVLSVAGLLASAALFQPIVRKVMDLAQQRTGMEITYKAASGTLILGQVKLEGLTLRRETADGLAFDLEVDLAEADVNLLSLIGREPTLQFAKVAGVRGRVTPPVDKDTPKLDRKRRAFVANLVDVSDVTLQIAPRKGEAYPIVIRTAQVAPLYSQTALFSLLFRATLDADVAGQRLVVATREISDHGREAFWQFKDVELSRLAPVVPKAPLTWFDGGTVTAIVQDQWNLSDAFIDMDWHIALKDASLAAPEGAGAGERFLAASLGKIVDLQGGNAEFDYKLRLDEDGVEALRSGDLDQFWDIVMRGLLKNAGPEPTASDEGEVRSRTQRLLDGARNILRDTEDGG